MGCKQTVCLSPQERVKRFLLLSYHSLCVGDVRSLARSEGDKLCGLSVELFWLEVHSAAKKLAGHLLQDGAARVFTCHSCVYAHTWERT